MTKHLIQELSFEDFINNYESIDSVKSSEKLKREVTKILDEVKNSKDNALINLSKSLTMWSFHQFKILNMRRRL